MVWQKNLKVYEQNGDLLGEWDIPELNPWKKKLYKMETNRTKWRFVAGRLSMENSL